jgi:DNA replication protein DnaC
VSDWAKQIWYIIIDRRYSDMKPTIYTSNLSLGEIAEFYGDRIASRLSAGIVLTIDAKDYRLANRVK